MDTVEIRSSVDKMNHTDKYWAIKQLCDEVDRLRKERDEALARLETFQTTTENNVDALTEKYEAHVRTLTEAMIPLLLECGKLRNSLLADDAGDKLDELMVAAWRAIAATKGRE